MSSPTRFRLAEARVGTLRLNNLRCSYAARNLTVHARLGRQRLQRALTARYSTHLS